MKASYLWLLLLICMVTAAEFAFDTYDAAIDPIDESLNGQYKNLSDSSLLWGPYRSGLYFGIRPRIPRSLLSGLMWYNLDTYTGVTKIRHFYEQQDSMKKANWVYYDPRIGGRQVITDKECHINIIIDFIKSEDGLSWGVKVKAKPQKGHENVKTAFVWYSGLEAEVVETDIFNQDRTNGAISLDIPRNDNGVYAGPVQLTGISEELGVFTLTVTNGPSTNRHPKPKFNDRVLDPTKNHHLSLLVPNDHVWKAKDIFVTLLQDSIQDLTDNEDLSQIPPEQSYILRDLTKFQGNLHFVQKIFEGECEFEVLYKNAYTPKDQQITSENFKTKLKAVLAAFESKFQTHFQLSPPFDKEEYQPFAKEILSGLLGGISYFYGDHLVDRETIFDEESFESYELQGKNEGPHELFTLVPSRPFFPRGFLWDEGFHLLPLLEYDSDLVLEITQSWFNLIDEDGWIAREQILGPESRSRVPEAFTVQSPQIVNPPTLMLVFTFLLDTLKDAPKVAETYGEFGVNKENLGHIVLDNPEVLTNYTRAIYPKLKSHYEMFRRTQRGFLGDFDRPEDLEVYRWRGRTLTHCLASGLDDYPRVLPADIAELNVDLLSWIGVMNRSIKLIAGILGIEEDVEKYQKIEDKIIKDLDDVHWSEKDGVYCDVSVDEDDEPIHACFKGYISLFPFITKMMREDDYDKLEKLVDVISDPDQLWSNYGLRSVSKSDPNYRTGENYWRSPIWVNINYLVLDALQHYKNDAMPVALKEKFAATYRDLRVNLVNNIFKEWKRTGFVWEQYDDETGEAKGAKNFLGWTSSAVLMMKLPQAI